MGSEFSILNDSEEVIWVSHGINRRWMVAGIGGGLALVAVGTGIGAAVAAGIAVTAGTGTLALVADGVVVSILAEGISVAAAVAIGLGTASTISGLLGIGVGVHGTLKKDDQDKITEAQNSLKSALRGFVRIEPGDSYYPGVKTLSLCMKGYVIRDSGKLTRHNVWSGPTHGSNYEYKVSEYF